MDGVKMTSYELTTRVRVRPGGLALLRVSPLSTDDRSRPVARTRSASGANSIDNGRIGLAEALCGRSLPGFPPPARMRLPRRVCELLRPSTRTVRQERAGAGPRLLGQSQGQGEVDRRAHDPPRQRTSSCSVYDILTPSRRRPALRPLPPPRAPPPFVPLALVLRARARPVSHTEPAVVRKAAYQPDADAARGGALLQAAAHAAPVPRAAGADNRPSAGRHRCRGRAGVGGGGLRSHDRPRPRPRVAAIPQPLQRRPSLSLLPVVRGGCIGRTTSFATLDTNKECHRV